MHPVVIVAPAAVPLAVIRDFRHISVLVASYKPNALAQDAAANTAFTPPPFVVAFSVNSSFSFHHSYVISFRNILPSCG